MDPTLPFLERYRDHGLFIMRVGVGAAFMVHGWPKISGGPEMWERLGGAVGIFGLDFAPVFWGFMAAVSEFVGGMLLALGLFARTASFLLCCTMVVAASSHIAGGDGFNRYSHALKLVFVFAGLLFTGAGKFSIDAGLERVFKGK
jgi:putative oxidoreductase